MNTSSITLTGPAKEGNMSDGGGERFVAHPNFMHVPTFNLLYRQTMKLNMGSDNTIFVD